MTSHLLLGGGGFIGWHVAAALARRGEPVTIADRAGAAATIALDMGTQDFDALIAPHDVIHHYAWSTVPQTADGNPAADQQNVYNTLRLLEAMRHHPGKRLVFASSGGTVYGQAGNHPVAEDHPAEPVNAYGKTKLAVENHIRTYHARHGVDARIARISNPFGAGQDIARKQGAVGIFLARAMADLPVTIWGDGSVVRDYIHVTDVAQALAALAAAPRGTEVPTFNIGSGHGLSLNQIVAAIESLLGKPMQVQYGAPRSFDIPVSILDVTRAARLLDWRPSMSFAQALALTHRDMLAMLRGNQSGEASRP